ncbi:MAG TPA: glycosyltransferase family 87 protein [Sphingomicrobium sp.]|nr:glycosyltransferase family 87 protein [Sphingomicrobium sp.]
MGNGISARLTVAVAALFCGIIAAVCWIMVTDPKPVDFLSFWAAGRMIVDGAGAQIYDIEAHRAVERTVTTGGLLPFPYPPPFALLLAPFGALPFGFAFTVWVGLTGLFYVVAARAWMPAKLALAQSSVLVNGFIGQNAFLTSGLFLAGLHLLKTRPLLAGAILGLLVIKPQLAIMLPVAMIAGRHWHAVAGGALSASALLLIGFVALGGASYAAFFEILSTYTGFVSESRWNWRELASVYALLRYVGLADGPALSIHIAVAAIAAVMVCQWWWHDRPGKEAVLAAATLLAPPYLLTYDGVLLGLPVAWLLLRGQRPRTALLVWSLAFLTIIAVTGIYELPNTLSLGALVALAGCYLSQHPKEKAAAPFGTAASI